MKHYLIKKILPKDERKRENILYTISEATIIFFITLFIYAIINRSSLNGTLMDKMIIGSIIFLVSFVFIRYISSEVTRDDINTKRKFYSQLYFKILSNFIISIIIVLSLTFTNIISLKLITYMIMFVCFFTPLTLVSYLELYISYRANKKLFN
ncbi:hypothetical protein ELD30_10180 [Staphylococcus pseudintermedius]|nr:hypothetical protein [Staphylococcus pseudintermedius]EGQ4340075.1 hypothetical protein [Staphylococcus pseudintermedius]